MIGFCPLASGSKGNSTYIGSSTTRILLDAGLTCKQLSLRLESLGVAADSIDGIVISHEHTDHCRGLGVFCRRYECPVYANAETAKALLELFPDLPHLKIFDTGSDFNIGDIQLHAFRVQHDAVDPVMFTAHFMDHKLGLCTDLGFATSLVRAHLQECDYLIVEANHHPHMVHACSRPQSYKQRVLSRSGHLSNEACGQLLNDVHSETLKTVYLGHLSSECNHPTRAVAEIREILADRGNGLQIRIAEQDVVSEPVELARETAANAGTSEA